MVTVYHNPRCRKSREALTFLTNREIDFEIKAYLEEPPSVEDLSNVLDMLGYTPQELLRKGEAIYKESFKGKELTDEEWIVAMVENPKLIERPIVIKENKAVVARPAEKIEELL